MPDLVLETPKSVMRQLSRRRLRGGLLARPVPGSVLAEIHAGAPSVRLERRMQRIMSLAPLLHEILGQEIGLPSSWHTY